MHLGKIAPTVFLAASIVFRPGLARAEAPRADARPTEEVAANPSEGSPSPDAPVPHRLAHDTPLFLGLELAGSGVVALTLGLAVGSTKTTCGWCGTDALDRSVRDALSGKFDKEKVSIGAGQTRTLK